MPSRPTTRTVPCPNCGEMAVAVIPSNGTIVDDEERSDGKVRVDCRSCGERFLAYYGTDAEDR